MLFEIRVNATINYYFFHWTMWVLLQIVNSPKVMNVRRTFVILMSRVAVIQSQMQPADSATTKLSTRGIAE